MSLFRLILQSCRLAVIPTTADVLSTMLNKDQPPSFLESSTRTLSYLSTRVLILDSSLPPLYAYVLAGAGIFRSLLSFPDNTPEGARDFAKLPQVDRMCTLLLDSRERGAAVRFRRCIPNIRSHFPLHRVTLFAPPYLPLSSRSRWHMRMLW